MTDILLMDGPAAWEKLFKTMGPLATFVGVMVGASLLTENREILCSGCNKVHEFLPEELYTMIKRLALEMARYGASTPIHSDAH